jgi:hypothetical protein
MSDNKPAPPPPASKNPTPPPPPCPVPLRPPSSRDLDEPKLPASRR